MGQYEEALEKARKEYNAYAKDTTARRALARVFPELTESEDERIRKDIYALIRINTTEELASKYIAYLEKQNDEAKKQYDLGVQAGREEALYEMERQKEQKPVEIHFDNPNIQKFDPDVKVTTSDSSASRKELLYVSNKSYDIGSRDGVASVKPAEWSGEDEEMRLACIDIIEHFPIPFGTVCGPWGDCINWLKILPERFNPHPHWKPSEEQMSSLWQASIYYKTGKIKITGMILESLYNDLKKL